MRKAHPFAHLLGGIVVLCEVGKRKAKIILGTWKPKGITDGAGVDVHHTTPLKPVLGETEERIEVGAMHKSDR